MRLGFDRQLELLNGEMTAMGALCEQAIALSAKALETGDVAVAALVPELSAQIDRKEREIETLCMKLLLQQQPVARDLRVISSALKMVTDMERIGDQSADIAEIVSTVRFSVADERLPIREMAVAVIRMVTDCVEAFIAKDRVLAQSVIEYDDVVDAYFNKVKSQVIGCLAEASTEGEWAVDLLMISKYFERIGDHAENIARWVLFSITGTRTGGNH